MFRFLPLKVLSKILIQNGTYSSYQAVARSVKRIEQIGLVKNVVFENNSKVLYISNKGVELLINEVCISKEEINSPARKTGVTLFALEHTLKLSEIFLLFDRECKKHGIELISFTGDNSIKLEYKLSTRAVGNKNKRYVKPDGLIKLKKNGITKSYFLEYDTGTEYSGDIASKYQKYFGLYEKKYYDTERQEDFPSIIMISKKSTTRIDNWLVQDNLHENELYRWGNHERSKYKNVVHRGISNYEDIDTISSTKIDKFLSERKFLFIDYPTLEKLGLQARFLTHTKKDFILPDSFINTTVLDNM